ncbi:hypothetical protein EV122DRAFT_256882, partial [Schizophyllum commune]
PSFDARDFSLAPDVARNHSFDTREPARSFDTRESAPSSNAYEPSQYGGEPFQYARDSAPSRYAYEPPEECEREPRPSTQVFGQDVYVRESWAGLPPIVASASGAGTAGARAQGDAASTQPGSSAAPGSSAPWISATFSAPLPSQIAASRSAPPVPTSPFDRAGLVFTPDICICMPMGRRQGPRMILGAIRPKWELPQGRVKWLSAEMWCNALLTPRPRLQLRSSTEKMGASLTGGKPGSAGKGSTSKLSVSEGSLAAGSIGKSTPKSSFAAGTEGDQYASYAAPLHSNAPPSSYAYASALLTGGYRQQQQPSSLHRPNHSPLPQQHSHPTDRIVSPPGSPLARATLHSRDQAFHLACLLAHSRSLVDL